MCNPRSWLRFAALAVFALVAGCDKAEPPPPAKVAAPAPPPPPEVNAQVQRLAAEVYVYALPLVLTDLTREAQIGDAHWNTFLHRRKLPDPGTQEVMPNADFVYSRAWLDLGKEPVVVSAPDTRGRYYLLAMLDAWTNVAASLGTRTTGKGKAAFAIVGPKWQGKLPPGVLEVRSPTELAWLFGRIEIKDRSDLAGATRVQDDFTITPLGEYGKRSRRGKEAAAPAPDEPVGAADPRETLAKMDAGAFFTRVARLLPGNPPGKEDEAMRQKMQDLGIQPGQPFDVAKLDAITARSIAAGAKAGLTAVQGAAANTAVGDLTNGWSSDRAVGRWGTDYGKRAVAAWRGLGVNAPEDAIFLTSHLDSEGRRLDGSNRYVVHFDKGKTPPADGFWSLSMYDDKGHLVANPAGRYNIGNDDRLTTNPDGSIDIHVQASDPGGKANWLPAPSGPFRLVLRIYWPRQDAIDASWAPPGVKRAS